MKSGIDISLEILLSSSSFADFNLSFSLALFILAKLGNLSNSWSSCSNIFFASDLLKSSSSGLRVDFFCWVFLSIFFLFLFSKFLVLLGDEKFGCGEEFIPGLGVLKLDEPLKFDWVVDELFADYFYF